MGFKEVILVKNVAISIKENKMIIEIDLSQNFGKSKSGKSIIIASSEGNQSVTHGGEIIYVGLNVYKK